MRKLWFISDTHFGHSNVIKFKDENGNIARNFSSIKEHDKTIIENWNRVVGKNDTVFHCGDVALNRTSVAKILPKLNGSKRLILGNHDEVKANNLLPYFKKINLWRVFREYDFMLTHVPMDNASMRTTFNVHGHIHHNISPNPRHINICVDHTNFTPVSLEWILDEIEMRKKKYGL